MRLGSCDSCVNSLLRLAVHGKNALTSALFVLIGAQQFCSSVDCLLSMSTVPAGGEPEEGD